MVTATKVRKFKNAWIAKDLLSGATGNPLTPLVVTKGKVDKTDVNLLNKIFRDRSITATANGAQVEWVLQVSGDFSIEDLEKSIADGFHAIDGQNYVQYEVQWVG